MKRSMISYLECMERESKVRGELGMEIQGRDREGESGLTIKGSLRRVHALKVFF